MDRVNGRPNGQPPPQLVNQFTAGKTPAGEPVLFLQQMTTSQFDVLALLRHLKQGFKAEWLQVHLEIETPPPGLIVPE